MRKHLFSSTRNSRLTFLTQYSILGLNQWLHKNGLSYKKPKGVPHPFYEKK
jgi:transposase